MRSGSIVEVLLRVGVAFAFVYPAIAAFITPTSWVGFFPLFARDLVPDDILLLHVFSALEIIVALWILIARNIFIPSAIAAVSLFLIVVFNLELLDITFRDIPIMLMAVALAVLHYKKRRVAPPERAPQEAG